MPTSAPRLCVAPGCPHDAVRRGRCAAHLTDEYRRIERYRGSAASRGYNYQWTQLRQRVLRRRPFCVVCERAGVIQLAQELDHIVPLVQGGSRLDEANLQPLCRVCHAAKTAGENGGRSGRK